VSNALAEFVHDADVVAEDSAVAALVGDLCQDYLGVAYAGARAPLPWLRKVVGARVSSGGTSPVIGSSSGASLSDAAFLNGVLGHVLEYDDATLVPVGHPSVAILPPLLAVAADRHLGGAQLIRAYAIGLELHGRLGQAKRRRWLSTDVWAPIGVLGLVAAAGATARLIGLDTAATEHCLGLAAQSAGYLNAGIGTGGKALVAGCAARGATDAALLAEAGVTASTLAIDGPGGFVAQLLGADAADVLASLRRPATETTLATTGVAVKRYPSCYGTHWGVDALRRILDGRDAHDVRRVTVRCPSAMGFLDDPEPADVERSRFSYQYVLAVCLLDGAPGLAGFTPRRLADDAVRDTMRRIAVQAHPPATEASLAVRHIVTVELTNGDVVADYVRVPHGHPRDPMTSQEIDAKFTANTVGLAEDRLAALRAGLAAIAACGDVAELLGHLAVDPS
jgi:2-methylcitrate dehydratase PrpD